MEAWREKLEPTHPLWDAKLPTAILAKHAHTNMCVLGREISYSRVRVCVRVCVHVCVLWLWRVEKVPKNELEWEKERERVIARLVLANSCVICACKSACVSVCECAQCRDLVFITRAKNFFLFFSPKTHSQQSPHSFKPTFTTFQFSVGVCKEQKSQIRRKTILSVIQVIPKWIHFLATPSIEEVIIHFLLFHYR